MRLRALAAASLIVAHCLAPVGVAQAQPDLGAAVAQLKRENERLAARIDALERELERQSEQLSAEATAAPGEAAPPISSDPAMNASPQVAEREVRLARTPEVAIAPAPADRPVQGAGVGLQLNAGNSGGQVSLTLAQSLRASDVGPTQVEATTTAWSITGSAPVAKSGDTAPATLDSFVDSSVLKLRVTRLHLTMRNLLTDPAYVSLRDAAVEACAVRAADQAARDACRISDIDEGFIRAHLTQAQVDRYVELVPGYEFAWGYGLEGTVGYRKFKYIDVAAFAEASSEEVPWGVRAFGTFIPRPNRALVASIAYQQGYEEQAATVLCPVTTVGSTFTCLSGPNGLPKSTEKVLLAVEGRALVDLRTTDWQNGFIDHFGVAPQVTYDANNDDFGIDFPIYLAADDKGSLLGGLRFGYKTSEEGFNAGVFIGSAFDLFKR